MQYDDRTHAGRLLAAELVELGLPHPRVVLALPRGGVPVAVEIAAVLAAPLGIVVVRKIPAVGKLVQVGIRDFCEEEEDLVARKYVRLEGEEGEEDVVLYAGRGDGAISRYWIWNS